MIACFLFDFEKYFVVPAERRSFAQGTGRERKNGKRARREVAKRRTRKTES